MSQATAWCQAITSCLRLRSVSSLSGLRIAWDSDESAQDEIRLRFIKLLRADGELAASDKRGERAVTRSRRAGPRPSGIARRQEPDVRELRYVGDPLVA